jgi:hypothetical protein
VLPPFGVGTAALCSHDVDAQGQLVCRLQSQPGAQPVAQPAARLALWALLFACAIECLQGLGMADVLDLHGQTALHCVLPIALSATFDVWDLVVYG